MQLSVNLQANRLTDELVRDAQALRLDCTRHASGAIIVDAGINVHGGLEAGRRISEICLAGLADVAIGPNPVFPDWPWQVAVRTSQPVIACLASQYAGWSLSHSDPKYHALGSGPGRALAAREPLFAELDYRDSAARSTLILESDRVPPTPVIEKIASDCSIAVEQLTLILTPTESLAGGVQIAARVVEVALHKVHELKFPLTAIVEAAGSTPLPPPSANGLEAMGRTNDTILFGGQVHLWVDANDTDAQELADSLPSCNSKDYGKPFAQVFAEYQYDFFAIDPMLFSPALVAVTTLASGRTFRAGRLAPDLLNRSFNT